MPKKVEIFSAGCPVCVDAIEMVKRIACPACQVTVLNMMDPDIAQRARQLGIKSVPAVCIDGKLASCCAGRGPDEQTLKAALSG